MPDDLNYIPLTEAELAKIAKTEKNNMSGQSAEIRGWIKEVRYWRAKYKAAKYG